MLVCLVLVEIGSLGKQFQVYVGILADSAGQSKIKALLHHVFP